MAWPGRIVDQTELIPFNGKLIMEITRIFLGFEWIWWFYIGQEKSHLPDLIGCQVADIAFKRFACVIAKGHMAASTGQEFEKHHSTY